MLNTASRTFSSTHGRIVTGMSLGAVVAIWSANWFQVLTDLSAIALVLLVVAVSVYASLRVGNLEATHSKRVLAMGMPVVLAMLSQTAVNVIDTILVGHLPSEVALPGVAAIGLSLPIFWLVGGFLSAISVGTQALVARRYGEQKDLEAGATLTTAALVALVLGVVFSLLGYLALPYVLPFFNADPQVMRYGLSFTQIRYIGISSMVVTAAYKAFFDGTSKTHVHMVAAVIMNIINLVLCYGLIFGKLGFPRLEVEGAAWASTISSIVGTLVMIAWTFRPALLRRHKFYRWQAFRLTTAIDILRLSLPSGGATVIGMLGFLMFHKAVGAVDARSGLGIPANASATAVIQQIVMLIFLTSFAFGTATASLVSQSLGAKNPTLANRYAWESVKLGTLIMVVFSSFLIIFPEEIISAFIQSKSLGTDGQRIVLDLGINPLRIMAVAGSLIAAAVVFTQSLYGAGNTRFVMAVEGILHVGCLVPLAWFLGVFLDGGLIGIWSAAAIYVLLLALTMGWKFLQGDWQEIQI